MVRIHRTRIVLAGASVGLLMLAVFAPGFFLAMLASLLAAALVKLWEALKK